MDMPKRIRAMFRAATSDAAAEDTLDQFDEILTPNMRALRLTMTMADCLSAMGVSVADVVSMSLDITDRYCKRKVQFDINFTLITASQYRGDDKEPLTLVRQTAPRSPNNMLIQLLQELARDIHHKRIPLEEAEERLDAMLENPVKYPYWVTTIGGALISAGVGILLDAKPVLIAVMFLAGVVISYAVRWLSHKRLPLFFVQVLSSLFITVLAAVVSLLSRQYDIGLLNNIEPTLIIVGGIVMLVAGLAIVSAVQDAIDEFYVTANAKLLKVVMMTGGIVAGVLIGLYVARRLGVYIDANDQQIITGPMYLQMCGAAVIAAGYALSMQTSKLGILIAGGIGAFAWAIFQAVSVGTPLSIVVASGVAAVTVGVVATLFARVLRVPSIALMTAGIVPLVPGLTLYNGLFGIVGNANSDTPFAEAGLTLFSAVLIAFAIAGGVNFGHLIARPLRRTLVKARNTLHQRKKSRVY